MRGLVAVSVVTLAGVLATADALAQGPAAPQGGMPGMQHMPMHGQGGTMMDCPMMQRVASLDQRVRQLEERAGTPTPPAQPSAPVAPR